MRHQNDDGVRRGAGGGADGGDGNLYTDNDRHASRVGLALRRAGGGSDAAAHDPGTLHHR